MLRFLILLLAFGTVADAAPRRRAVHSPGGPLFHPLQSLTLTSGRADLEPLRPLVAHASIVALGDANHGTREFYTVKLRLIDFLVRELGFDTVSVEAPFPITERLNVYVQGGPGNPRALLSELNTRLLYLFWDTEEFLALIEWMREYNAHRGERPPLELAGADVYDESGAVAGVLAYLDRVDPAAATSAGEEYACLLAGNRSGACEAAAARVRDALVAREGDARELSDARQYAEVALQFFQLPFYEPRERSMARNLTWIREHRGSARKVVHWGHQEHIGKLPSSYTRGETMGSILSRELGREYVAIGTLAGSGSFLQWQRIGSSAAYAPVVTTLTAPPPASYEWRLRARGVPWLLVDLRGSRFREGVFRTAPTTGATGTVDQPLREKLDAVIYVDTIAPTTPLR